MFEELTALGLIVFSVVAVTVLMVLLIMNIRNAGTSAAKIIFIGLICLFAVFGIFSTLRLIRLNKVVGYYSGEERNYIEIDGETYKASYNNPYDSPDRDKLLGRAISKQNGKEYMYVWSVKDTDEYIYALSEYDGTFYKKQD